MYVNNLPKDTTNKYVFDHPIILGVFTVDSIDNKTKFKRGKRGKRNKSSCVYDDPQSRFGAFLCTKKLKIAVSVLHYYGENKYQLKQKPQRNL
jgi:hypothetical protein